MDTHHSDNRSVTITEKGPSGNVIYRDEQGSHTFYWEFGGGDILVILTYLKPSATLNQTVVSPERLQQIFQHVAREVIRQKAPSAFAEFDYEAGRIYLRSRPSNKPEKVKQGVTLYNGMTPFSRYKMILAAITLVIALFAVLFKVFLSVPSAPGIPIASSLRAGGDIVTLFRTQESYIPSLHRNPEKDRFSLSLLIVTADEKTSSRSISLGKNYRAGDLQLARILGYDGQTVWCSTTQIEGIRLATGKRISLDQIKKANPAWAETWDDPRRITFDGRLRILTPDRENCFEIDPETLKANPVLIPQKASSFSREPSLEAFLSIGVQPAQDEWLGLISSKEAEQHFKPHSLLNPSGQWTSSKGQKHFYHAELGPERVKGRREILSITRQKESAYLNAAFLRSGPEATPLHLSHPDSYLILYTRKQSLTETLVVARIDGQGNFLWETDTGLDRFKLSQILPDSRYPAFIGPPPPIPGKVPPQVLVLINTETGALMSTFLTR